jgi:2-polyprenyl-6-methoxyphenol hydroxylase-like FAD-dependent oxidoreductase
MIETPVLVVGGGPVGLTFALFLSNLGIKSVVVNERTEATTHPKLDVVNCRSMEIFRQLGLAEKIRDAGNPRSANQYSAYAASASGPYYSVMADRDLIYAPVDQANTMIRACTDGSMPLETMQRIAQMHLEPVLLDAAQADPNIDVRFGHRLFGFEQDETGVSALVHKVDSGEAFQFRSSYLVGCDGPSSRVRNFLNIDYDATWDLLGELYIVHIRSDEIAALYPNNEPYWHTWLSRPGNSGLLVSPDASRNDYVIHRPYPPRGDETIDVIVEAAVGKKISYELVQSGGWKPQFLVATSYGRGRVWMAGDSVHQYMPTGGLGMNTGVAEAHNLAWKVAARLQGWGGDRLVSSYNEERLPIGRRNRDHVKQNAACVFEAQFPRTDALLDDSSEGEANRAAMAHAFETKISRLYESYGVEIGYRYEGSSIIAVEAEPEPLYSTEIYVPTARPGARLPSAFTADGRAIFDLIDGRGFTLLVTQTLPKSKLEPLVRQADAVRLPLKIVTLEEPALAALYEAPMLLIRPDQHVAWRGRDLPDDIAGLIDLVRGA